MLRPFTQSDFPLLSKWVNSEKLMLQFSATTFSYPLNYTDMENYLALNHGRQFYIVNEEKVGDYGFGEIIPQTDNVPRLGRLLVGDPLHRDQAWAKK